jgi:mannose-6-phosphate isomerase-like protein (cupin superfamily)
MADYTQKNIKADFENMAEKFGLAPDVEARFGRSILGLEGGGFSYQRYAPNFQAPTAHRHEHQEEVYVIIAGGGRIKLGDDVHELKQWDAIRVPSQVPRGFAAGPEGLELIAIGFGEGGDAEMLEDFWQDA